jgi:hypothetical protein
LDFSVFLKKRFMELCVEYSRKRLESGARYMEKRNRRIHGIKYKTVRNKNLAHIRGYRNREKTCCGTLFFYVEFRGIGYFFQSFCQQVVVLNCGQDTG